MFKKIAAILLMLLLAFNWYGYRIVTEIWAIHSDQRLEARIDANAYETDQLIEIRIPLNLPYITDQADFERHYGEVEKDGIYYTYVKRKVSQGQLVLLCLPNQEKQQIDAAKDQFFKTVHGLNSDQEKEGSSFVHIQKTTIGDYEVRDNRYEIYPVVQWIRITYFPKEEPVQLPVTLLTPWQPPEYIV